LSDALWFCIYSDQFWLEETFANMAVAKASGPAQKYNPKFMPAASRGYILTLLPMSLAGGGAPRTQSTRKLLFSRNPLSISNLRAFLTFSHRFAPEKKRFNLL
jgi:hypothetical protein